MSETGPFTGLIWASETKRIRIWAPFPAGLQNGFRSRFCRSLGAKPRFRPGGAGARPVRGKSRRRLGAGPATVQRRAAGRRVRFRTRLRRKGISGGVVWTDRDPLRQATDPDGPLPGDGRSGAPDASASPVARLGPLSRWVPRRPSVAAPAAPAWRRRGARPGAGSARLPLPGVRTVLAMVPRRRACPVQLPLSGKSALRVRPGAIRRRPLARPAFAREIDPGVHHRQFLENFRAPGPIAGLGEFRAQFPKFAR